MHGIKGIVQIDQRKDEMHIIVINNFILAQSYQRKRSVLKVGKPVFAAALYLTYIM
jgi:hypothetical protein